MNFQIGFRGPLQRRITAIHYFVIGSVFINYNNIFSKQYSFTITLKIKWNNINDFYFYFFFSFLLNIIVIIVNYSPVSKLLGTSNYILSTIIFSSSIQLL